MTYNPAKDAPRTQEQLVICVDHFEAKELAKAQADPAYVPKSRAELEKMYSIFLSRPEQEVPAPTFAELKREKLSYLDAAFYTACQRPTVTTQGGWPADANETANRNVQGLITTMETGGVATVQFCDAENQFHEIGLDELKAIQLLIIAKGQQLYARKWELRSAIEAANDEVALNSIEISFAD